MQDPGAGLEQSFQPLSRNDTIRIYYQDGDMYETEKGEQRAGLVQAVKDGRVFRPGGVTIEYIMPRRGGGVKPRGHSFTFRHDPELPNEDAMLYKVIKPWLHSAAKRGTFRPKNVLTRVQEYRYLLMLLSFLAFCGFTYLDMRSDSAKEAVLAEVAATATAVAAQEQAAIDALRPQPIAGQEGGRDETTGQPDSGAADVDAPGADAALPTATPLPEPAPTPAPEA